MKTPRKATATAAASKQAAAPSSDAKGSGPLLERLRELYEAETERAVRFRYGLLVFDLATLAFIVASSFVPRTVATSVLDIVFGLGVLADVFARFYISRSHARDLLNPVTWTDAIAIVSFLAPLAGEHAGFLRILRTLRLLHTYRILAAAPRLPVLPQS